MFPSLHRHRGADLGLAALVDAAGALLDAIGHGVGDERVQSRPDARTIRYYQSLGILDRPSRHDGREAVYGYRHLLQAVTTKLLQAEGLSLAQIQRALAGRPTEALEAAVEEALGRAGSSFEPSSSWGGGASPPATPPLGAPGLDPPRGPRPPDRPAPPPPDPPAPRALVTREVAPGVLVTVDPRLVPDPEAVLARLARALTLVPGDPR